MSPLVFTGDEHDTESNLEHTQFRQLSAVQGRWLSPDPAGMAAVDITIPQTLNLYAYVENNPMNGIDPSGLSRAAPPDPGEDLFFSQYDAWMFGSAPCSMCGQDTRMSDFNNQALATLGKHYWDLPGTNYFGSNYAAGVMGWYQQMVDNGFSHAQDSSSSAYNGPVPDQFAWVDCEGESIFHFSCLPPDIAVPGSLPFMRGDVPAGFIAQQMLQGNRNLWAQGSMTANVFGGATVVVVSPLGSGGIPVAIQTVNAGKNILILGYIAADSASGGRLTTGVVNGALRMGAPGWTFVLGKGISWGYTQCQSHGRC